MNKIDFIMMKFLFEKGCPIYKNEEGNMFVESRKADNDGRMEGYQFRVGSMSSSQMHNALIKGQLVECKLDPGFYQSCIKELSQIIETLN